MTGVETEYQAWLTLVEEEAERINDIIELITGYRYESDCEERCLTWYQAVDQSPASRLSQPRKIYVGLYRDIEEYYHHPVGIVILVNMDEVNGYAVEEVFWNAFL